MNERWICARRRVATLVAVAAFSTSILGCASVDARSGLPSSNDPPVITSSWTGAAGGNVGATSDALTCGTTFSEPALQMSESVRTDLLRCHFNPDDRSAAMLDRGDCQFDNGRTGQDMLPGA